MIGLKQSSLSPVDFGSLLRPGSNDCGRQRCSTRFPLLRFRQVRAINCGGNLSTAAPPKPSSINHRKA
jgi:hypothetical protein